MRVLILTAVAALAFGPAANAAPCRDPTTHKFVKCPPTVTTPAVATARPTPAMKRAPASRPATPMAAMAGHHPNCKKGKACGNSCIAMSKVCHKPT